MIFAFSKAVVKLHVEYSTTSYIFFMRKKAKKGLTVRAKVIIGGQPDQYVLGNPWTEWLLQILATLLISKDRRTIHQMLSARLSLLSFVD